MESAYAAAMHVFQPGLQASLGVKLLLLQLLHRERRPGELERAYMHKVLRHGTSISLQQL